MPNLDKLKTAIEDVYRAARLRYNGYSIHETAGVVGVSEAAVRAWSKEPWWIEILQEIGTEEDELRLGLARRGHKELLVSQNESERGKAVRFELERRDHMYALQATKPATQKHEEDRFDDLSAEELRELVRLAKEKPSELEVMKEKAKKTVAGTIDMETDDIS